MSDTTDYGSPLTLGYPAANTGWTRPWGLITTERITTRGKRLLLSTKSVEQPVAYLTTAQTDPAVLETTQGKRARAWRRGTFADFSLIAFSAVLLPGGLLLGTVLYPFASGPAVLALLALAILAAGLAWLWRRNICQQAHTDLTAAGHQWCEIRLGEDALADLVLDLDALAYDWQHGRVADEIWTSARTHVYTVADAARAGARIDKHNHELVQAKEHIARARTAIAADGRVDHVSTTGETA